MAQDLSRLLDNEKYDTIIGLFSDWRLVRIY
jgi:hypothetical protein